SLQRLGWWGNGAGGVAQCAGGGNSDPGPWVGAGRPEGATGRPRGSRVTPEVYRWWGLLGRLGAGHLPSGGTCRSCTHTDWGIRRLASYPEQLAACFEIPERDIVPGDPRQ